MAGAVAIRYYNAIEWTTASGIWLEAHANYQMATSYDLNHLQWGLYESTLEELGTVLEYINHIQDLRDKLVMWGHTPASGHRTFDILEGLPETQE